MQEGCAQTKCTAAAPSHCLRGTPFKTPLLLTVLFTACQHIEPPSIEAEVATDIPARSSVFASGAVQGPTSAAALLTNLRRALAEPLLLSDALYEEAVLGSFFGASAVQTIGRRALGRHVLLRGLEYLPARERSQTQIGIRKVQSTNAAPQTAVLSLFCSCELQLQDVEAVFGTTDRVIAEDRPPTPGHLPALPPPRSALGNLRVTYVIKTPSAYASTLSVVTDPVGNIRLIEARQWRSL